MHGGRRQTAVEPARTASPRPGCRVPLLIIRGMQASSVHLPRARGFTLVELMIVLVILALLAGLAWPVFNESVQKSRRSDAMSALAGLMQAQERWRANNPTYSNSLNQINVPATSADGLYTISIVDGSTSATAYTARATARAGQKQSADTRCQVMTVAIAGGNVTYTSASSEGANAAPDPCWVR